MLKSTCDYGNATWIGSGGSGKTTKAAGLALQWWWEAPFESAVMTCSTTIKMLKLRIWSEVTRLFCAMPKTVEFRDENGELVERTNLGYLGELVDSDLMIRWAKGDHKHAIFGFGVNEGSVAEAVTNLVGIHARRIWLILDELQGIREAIDGAKDNMSKNALFRVLGMGNTDENMKSLLRRAAKPINGWGSVDVDNAESWETDGGVVCEKGIALRFDARKSPAIANPKKYPYLINQKQIDAHLRKVGGNENDPSFCSQVLARWPAVGLASTILDIAIIEKFNCKGKAEWTDGFEQGAALDPAFTEGGDRKILQLFKFGKARSSNGESRWVIEMGEWLDVPIDSQLGSDSVSYQLVEFCKRTCENAGIPSTSFAMDSTGGGITLKDVFQKEWGQILAVDFSGSASDRIIDGERTAKQYYDRRVSELCHSVRSFALSDGLRGLSDQAANQACERRTTYKNKKQVVEKKSEYKLRAGESPDNLDAVMIAVEYAMTNGATPGNAGIVSKRASNLLMEMAEENARMRSEESYLVANY